MNVSQNALDIIKEFEGLRLEAYLDPVNIPTVGYGTIRYPDGRKVALGHCISEEQADGFLQFECEHLSREVSESTHGVQLNQNQFDALISFCYNLGLGAFLRSTLLKKLRAGDFPGASAEFPRWSMGTVNGIKTVLRGLERRRAKERKLFDSQDLPLVAPPPKVELSSAELVRSIRGIARSGVNFIVAFDEKGSVVEVLELGDRLPDTLMSAVKIYPNLVSFDFSEDEKITLPEDRVVFSGPARPLIRVDNAPKLDRDLLVIGMEDEEGQGDDIKQLQARLRELGYYTGQIDGVFERATDSAARDFQADYFGRGEADGKVGSKTWAKLWGDAKPSRPTKKVPSVRGQNYLKLTQTNSKDQFGLVKLQLAYYKDGVFVDSFDVCSGQARKQIFKTGASSRAKSMEPLPEGEWTLHDIEWAAGKDNYSGTIWSRALGPAKIRMDYSGPGRTERSAIQIHMDWNRTAGAPGTAGCIGVQNVADFKTLVAWLRESDPKSLFVDWELNTCPRPSPASLPANALAMSGNARRNRRRTRSARSNSER